MGLLAGRLAAAERLGRPLAPPPATTAIGALLRHITGGAEAATFQPMNVNFGLFPPLDDARAGRRGRRDRYRAYTDRAKADFTTWLTPAPSPPDGQGQSAPGPPPRSGRFAPTAAPGASSAKVKERRRTVCEMRNEMLRRHRFTYFHLI